MNGMASQIFLICQAISYTSRNEIWSWCCGTTTLVRTRWKDMRREELIKLMPENKDDARAARALVQLGASAIEPVWRDMLLWLRVSDSPVADIFAEFFAKIDPQPVGLIAKHIATQQELMRKRILTDILQAWPREAVVPLTTQLTMLATHPDVLNNDIECFRLILKHDLADRAWVRKWLTFRKEQTIERLQLFEKLETTF